MTFGTTPWGKIFLEALNNYYHADSKRLGRGRSYANSGKVKSIKIEQGKLDARIQGQQLYKTYIQLSEFEESIRQKIIEIIKKNPLFLAEITNGVLSENFLKQLESEKIDIFPKDWGSLKRDCSCPDWGNPCKHLAALYFVLVSEIDKNPFLIFELRGLDLKKEFEIQHITEIKNALPLTTTKELPQVIKTTIPSFEDKDYLPFILSMIAQSVPYLERDFREVHAEFYKKYQKDALVMLSPFYTNEHELCEKIFKESNISFISYYSEPRFEIKTHFINDLKKIFNETNFENNSFFLNPMAMARLFRSFKDKNGNDNYYYFYSLFALLYELIKTNGYIFDVDMHKNGYYTILKPLDSIEEIREALEVLYAMTPQVVKIKQPKKLEYFTQKSQSDLILSKTLSYLAQQVAYTPTKGKAEEKMLLNSIFSCSKIPDSAPFDITIAKSIDNSYEIFNIQTASFTPRVIIDKESEESFVLSIMIDNIHLKDCMNTEKSIEILKFLHLFKPLLPEIETLTSYQEVELSTERLKDFLLYSKEYLINLGFKIALPKELVGLLRPRTTLKAKSKTNASQVTFLNLDSMLEFNYAISLGDYEITLKEFEKLVLQQSALLKFRDHFVLIDPKEAQKLLTYTKKPPKLSSFEILAEFLNGGVVFDTPLQEEIEKFLEPKKIEPPKTLQASLREYQKRGLEWIFNNLLNGFGVILADDMGLGKTLQSLSVILYLKEIGRLHRGLIVVPTSLLNNWESEIKKFTPTLSYAIYHGSKRTLNEKTDLIISTYQLVTRDFDKLNSLKLDLIVIDEAQNIKNIEAKTTKAINALKATYRIALSGTPVENNLSELWSIFHFAIPGYLGTHTNFSKKYAKPIEVDRDRRVSEKLKRITAPFMLRRLKSDKNIISDLPDKIIIDELASLTPTQSALYKSVVDDELRRLEEAENYKGEIFRLITALKQICNHPRNFDKISPLDPFLSGKTELLLTLLDSILGRDEKVLIFTQYVEMGKILENIIEEQFKTVPLFLHGGLNKIKRDEIIEEFKSKFEKKVFILSLKAGGVGLNLTEACNVIHYDLWFNPAVENQATDRAFRIGQQKNVIVHRLITKNSFEEKIDAIIKSKSELTELSVSTGESWLSDMNKDEIKALFEVV